VRRLLPMVLAVAAASPAFAQYKGGSGGPSSAQVEATAPTNPADGQIWVRSSDKQRFYYDAAFGKWLGDLVTIHVNRSAANATGAFRIGETATSNSLPPYAGFDVAGDSLRIMGVNAKSYDTSTTATCTTFVFSDADTILKLVWDVNEEVWTPGGSGWVSPAARVAVGPGKTISFYGSGGGILPDFPMMWFYCRKEVSP